MSARPTRSGAAERVELLSITEASLRLSCSRGHVYNLIATGQLRAVEIRIAGAKRPKTRVRADDLAGFVEACTRTASPARPA